LNSKTEQIELKLKTKPGLQGEIDFNSIKLQFKVENKIELKTDELRQNQT